MEYLADVARTTGVDPSLVHWSGATRIEKEDTNAEDDVQKPHLVTGAARP